MNLTIYTSRVLTKVGNDFNKEMLISAEPVAALNNGAVLASSEVEAALVYADAMVRGEFAEFLEDSFPEDTNNNMPTTFPDSFSYSLNIGARRAMNKGVRLSEVVTEYLVNCALSQLYKPFSSDLAAKHLQLLELDRTNLREIIYSKATL